MFINRFRGKDPALRCICISFYLVGDLGDDVDLGGQKYNHVHIRHFAILIYLIDPNHIRQELAFQIVFLAMVDFLTLTHVL